MFFVTIVNIVLDIIPQVIANSLIAGSLYLLAALGFNLIFGTARFFDLGYGALAAVSGYCFLFLTSTLHLGATLSFIFAILAGGFLSLLVYLLVYRQMRQRKATSLVILIASLGVMIFLEAVLAMIFTSQFQGLSQLTVSTFSIGSASVTSIQLWTFITAITSGAFCLLFLKFSSFGKAVKAVRDDEEVAKIVGVNTETVMRAVFFFGGVIMSIAGILFGLDTGIQPTAGFSLLLKGIIVSIIGGAGSIGGGIIGAFFLAFTENFGVVFVGAEWKDTIAFGLLILFLIFRPSGIMRK